MDIFANEIKLIYDRLADTVSQEIFINRLAYSLTGNIGSLRNVIKTFSGGREFIEKLDQAVVANRKICIFGSGIWGKSIIDSNLDIDFYCFVDNDLKKCRTNMGGGSSLTF